MSPISPTTKHHYQLFRLVLTSTSPVRASSAACVESSDVMPRPMTRRPPRLEPDEPEEPDALRAWLLPPLLDLLPVLRDPRLALPFPAVEPPLPLALIPPLLPPLLLPLPLCFAIVTLR